MIDIERFRRIDEIFQAALELRPDERPSYISQACSGDESLLREVECLLTSDERDWELINAPAFEMAAPLLVKDRQELSAGERLGHYAILSLLGAGGMGQVYLAEDTRLGRKVALKLLPAGSTRDESRLRRFRQEAQAASALNHPNIVTIYDIWEIEGRHVIATEYIEGETLRQRIQNGALSTGEALDISAQVASALAAAHHAGIIHRDIKPDNIMLRRDGLVKVLDFGLAKLTESPVAAARLSDAVEETIEALSSADVGEKVGNRVHTESGLLIGTPPYMSPEQLEGEQLDARTDIFSLGVVTYELLTGQTPFHRERMVDVVAAILHTAAPPFSKRQLDAPTELERIVAKALRKDRTERYQSVQELLTDLRALDKSAAARPRQWRVVWGLVALVVASAFGFYWWLARPPMQPRLLKLSRLAAYGDITFMPAVSPDGKYLAFSSNLAGEGHSDIWVRPFDGGEPIQLTNLPGFLARPDFSPDGTEIAFERQAAGHDGVYVVSALGGEPRLVGEQGGDPRWSPDGKWLAYWVGGGPSGPDSGRKVFLVPASGGEPRQFRPDFLTASFPVWSPDGKYIIFMGIRDREQDVNDWWVAPVEGGEAIKTGTIDIFTRHKLSAPPSRWTPDNYILFTSNEDNGEPANVWRIPLDPGSWKTLDRPEQLTYGTGTIHTVALLPDGRLVFDDTRQFINLWSLPVDADEGKVTGEAQPITRDEANNIPPWLSADGDKLMYGSSRGGRSTWRFRDLKSGRELRLNCPDGSYGTVLSPDGKAVVFVNQKHSSPDTSTSLFAMSVDGGQAEKLIEGIDQVPYGWLFSRNQVLFVAGSMRDGGSPQVFLLDINTKKSQMVLEHNEYRFSWILASPDDQWISFEAARQGRVGVFIAPLHPDRVTPESEWVAVTDGSVYAGQPRWSPGGKLLYFISVRDGSNCIFAQRLDPVSKRPVGEAFAVNPGRDSQRVLPYCMTLAHDKLVFAGGEFSSSIWLAAPQ